MEATQARRRVAARWPLTLGLAALVAGAAPAQMPSSAVGNEPGATPVTTGWTYSDIFWQTYISVPSGYSVTPDYAVGETSIPVQVYGPSTTTVDFLWDYAWYFFDEYWNYLGEEYDQRLVPVASYQLMVHGAKRKAPARPAIRNAKAINLVGGGDQGGRIMPDRGATLSKHWRRTSRGQAVDDSYESLLGVDLSQDAEVFYFPRPDISVISRRMVAQDASPLQFRRVFREKASGNSVGMPAGWFHSWDVRATQTNNGDVVLQLPALDPDQWAAGDLGKPRPAAQSLGYELHARGGNKATGYRRLIVNWRDPLGAGTQWELVPERGQPLEFRLQSVERPSGETRWFTWGGSPLRLLAISDSAGAALELEYQGDALKTVRSSMGPWDNDGTKQAKATYDLKQDKWTIVSTSRPSPNSKEKERWVIDLNRAGGQVLDIQDSFGSVKRDKLTVTRTASQLPVIKDRQGKVVREYQGQPGNIKPKP
ncbi:MAG: hypothetical protein HUU35_15465 [Armatimonadetes bacterium]|nr:hypothetical protein [Armatimonadota bacterium]